MFFTVDKHSIPARPPPVFLLSWQVFSIPPG